MKTQSKRYKESEKQVDRTKTYSLKDAIALLKTLPAPKFDGSVDLHFKLNIDSKKSDQMVRGTVVLLTAPAKKSRSRFSAEESMSARQKRRRQISSEPMI